MELKEGELLTMTGYDEAVIGIEQSIEPKLVYDIDKIAKILMTRDEMSEEDAYDFISFNITSTYVGENTPSDSEYIKEFSYPHVKN
jgi:hypothetical protein